MQIFLDSADVDRIKIHAWDSELIDGVTTNPTLILKSGGEPEEIYQQLKNFQLKNRANDMNKMMRNIVHRMSEEEMKAVAQYIQGLY